MAKMSKSCVVLSIALVAACDGLPDANKSARPQWLILLESDFRIPPLMAGGTGLSAPETDFERCGRDKLEEIWRTTDQILRDAEVARASVNLVANVSGTTVDLGTVHFNDLNEKIAAVEASADAPDLKDKDMRKRFAEVRAQAVSFRKKHEAKLDESPQATQEIFHLIGLLESRLSDKIPQRPPVVVIFVSDMVHYNTSLPVHFKPEKGQMNMLQDPDRLALKALRDSQPDWWLDGRSLSSVAQGEDVEIRRAAVNRCSSGEQLPGTEAANWALIRSDVREFWVSTFKELGIDEKRIIWDYRPPMGQPVKP